MHYMNGTCLLSVSVFILCLHSALSNRQQSRNYVSGQNYTSRTARSFIINSQSLRRPAYNNGRDRNDSIAETTSAGISFTSRSDNGRTRQKWMDWRLKSAKYSRQNLVYPTSGPFLQLSTQADIGIIQGFPSNSEFDIIRETTYLCLSSRDCDNILERSFCDPSGRCRCFYPYLFDGEKCQYRDDIEYCSSHRDCYSVQYRRCILVNSTGDKICKCNYGLIFYERRCLPRDAHQCQNYEDCQKYLENSHCRYEVNSGRRVCSCSRNYVKYGNKCLIKVLDGRACNHSVQCIAKISICHGGYCRCFYGDEDSCVYVISPKHRNRNLLLPTTIITLVIAFSVILFIVSGILLSKRFISRCLHNHSNRRTRTISETCAQSIDKPPTYDEVISSPAIQTLSIEELSQIPPPSYDTVRQCQQPISAST